MYSSFLTGYLCFLFLCIFLYVSYLFVEILTGFFYSFSKFTEQPYKSYMPLFSLVLLLEFCFVVSFGTCFFVFSVWLLPCFVSMYKVDLLCFAVLAELPCVLGILWGPVAVSLATGTRWSRDVPCVPYVCPPVVFESWLLLTHQWVGVILRQTVCEDQPWLKQMSSYVEADLTE